MKSMYPGVPFSPPTALSSSIGAADTIISVEDGSVLPPGPNYATIGNDIDGEVVFYAVKAENTLSGCERGIEGTAQEWNAGAIIGRNFNNIDYKNLIDNINDLNSDKFSKIETYVANNLISIDSDGNLSDSGKKPGDFVPIERTINGNSLNDDIVLTSSDIGAVPTTRTVNDKALSDNITLSAGDVGAVPTTRTVNEKALSADITLSADDVGAVPTARTVNGKALSSDITLSAGDVGAMPTAGGAFTGQVTAGGGQAVGTAQVRNIYAGTADLTAGSSALATGALYFVYE